jgi:hypothetical protein
MKDLFKNAITWFAIMVACISAAIVATDGSKLEMMFEFWALMSFFVWIWRCHH